jgi:metalloendopeptidase OMA1, mitochondrial
MSIDVCVVDLGCGSGLWCLEVADEFPNVKVVGVDISPVQPIHDVPVNCDFLMDNLLDGLPFDTGSIDFSQSRCSIPHLFPFFHSWFRACYRGC